MSSTTTLPRGLLAWMPFLWSRVLFPGAPAGPHRVRPLSLLVLLVLPAALLYPSRSFRLLEPDEGRYAQIPREMLQRGEWVVPTLQGEPYLDKPPLLYWLTALAYAALGVSDAAARLIPALAVHGTILVVYLLGRRSLGERSAFWGALLLAVSPGFVGMGRILILDGLLTLWVTLSIFAAFEAVRGERLKWGWLLMSAAASGLGVLAKGPVVEVLLLPPLLAHRWLTGKGAKVGFGALLAYLGVVAAINLPWFLAIYLKRPEFLRHFFWEHNVVRFVSGFDHLQPVWYYVPVLLGGLLPATLFLVAFVRFLVSGEDPAAERRSAELGFWLLAGAWCVCFFSISGAKLPTYILPAFPPLTLAVGDFIARSRWCRSAWTCGLVAGSAGLLAATFYVALPWYAAQRSPMLRPELMARYVGDRSAAVVCYPRNCDSVAFYLGRDDLRNVRSKFAQQLVEDALTRPRTVVLFTHRHSLAAFRHVLPPQLRITEEVALRRDPSGWKWLDRAVGETPWGLCDIAVIERVR